MRLKILLSFSTLMLLCLACTPQKRENKTNSIKDSSLQITEEQINFELPENFNGNSYQIHYIAERNLLAVYNSEGAEILFFDFATGQLSKRIILEKEGPNGILRPASFHYFKEDSLLVSSLFGLYFINEKAEIHSKILIHDLDNYDEISDVWLLKNPYSELQYEVGFEKDRILIGAQLGGTFEYSQDFLEKYKTFPLNLEISPSKNRIEKVAIHYPAELFTDGISRLDYSRIFVGNKQIFSFNSHDIHIWDGQKMIPKQARSTILSDQLPKLTYEASAPQVMLNIAFLSEGYGSIKYDPYRNLYYRFVYGTVEGEVPFNRIMEEFKYPKVQSIIVLDANFKKIDELILPENKYALKMSFTKEDGLYVSTHNPKNDSIAENEWGFRKLEFK